MDNSLSNSSTTIYVPDPPLDREQKRLCDVEFFRVDTRGKMRLSDEELRQILTGEKIISIDEKQKVSMKKVLEAKTAETTWMERNGYVSKTHSYSFVPEKEHVIQYLQESPAFPSCTSATRPPCRTQENAEERR